MLQVGIFETLQKNLASIDFTILLNGVMTIADEVDSQLSQAMDSYIEESLLQATPSSRGSCLESYAPMASMILRRAAIFCSLEHIGQKESPSSPPKIFKRYILYLVLFPIFVIEVPPLRWNHGKPLLLHRLA